MTSHVGTIIIEGFPLEKQANVEELWEQQLSSAMDPNFPFEQGKPRCMSILITHRVLYNLCLQMYYALTYRI
jgi:hypothetical protein